MSVTGTRDRGSNWCAGTGPASARQPPARPDNILFFIHWSHLILTFSNNSTRNCRDCCWKYVYKNTNLKSSKSSSFKNAIGFLTVCNKLRSPGIATVAMQQLGTCPLLFWDISNRRIEKDPFSSSLNLLFIIHIYPDKMWCVVHSLYYREICNDDKDSDNTVLHIVWFTSYMK